MKVIELFDEILPGDLKECVEMGRSLWKKHPQPVQMFLLMCLNLAIAPAVYAAGESFSRTAAWALGLLGIVILGLSFYLFVVIFQPERF